MVDYANKVNNILARIQRLDIESVPGGPACLAVVEYSVNYLHVIKTLGVRREDLSDVVKSFLNSVWSLYISSPDYREYACDIAPSLELNRYLIELAELTAVETRESKYQLLFPTLELTEDYWCNDIDECWPHEFIICGDRYEGFFHIESGFSYLANDGNDNYKLRLGFGNSRDLLPAERDLLCYKSSHARNVLTRQEICKASAPFYFNEMSQLRVGLKLGDYRHGGDEHNAGDPANLAILKFKGYYDTLSPHEQSEMLALPGRRLIDAEMYHYTFGSVWNYLINPTYTQAGRQTVAYCIFYKGEDIDAILSGVKRQQVALNDKLAQSILRFKKFSLAIKLVEFSDCVGVADLKNLSKRDYARLIDVAIESKSYPMITELYNKSKCIISYKTILSAANCFDQFNYSTFLNVLLRYGALRDGDGGRVALTLLENKHEKEFSDLVLAGDNQFTVNQLHKIISLILEQPEINFGLLGELLDHNAVDIDSLTMRGDEANSLLHIAVLSNRVRLAEVLMMHGARISTPNERGETPLSLAIERENWLMAKSLITDAQFDLPNTLYCNAMMAFKRHEQVELINILLGKQSFPFVDTLDHDYLDLMTDIINRLKALDKIDQLTGCFKQALACGSSNGRKLARYLMTECSDVFTRERMTEQLYQAMRDHNLKGIAFLLRYKIDISIQLLPILVSYDYEAINVQIVDDISSGALNIGELFFNDNVRMAHSIGTLWFRFPEEQKKKLFECFVSRPVGDFKPQFNAFVLAGLTQAILPSSIESSAQLKAFVGVYMALRNGQTSLFKTNFIQHTLGAHALERGYNDSVLLLAVINHAHDNPDSRTAHAWMLTQQYYGDNWQNNSALFKDVHEYAYQHSSRLAGSALFKVTDGRTTGELVAERRLQDTKGKTRTSKILSAFAAAAA